MKKNRIKQSRNRELDYIKEEAASEKRPTKADYKLYF